MCSQAKNVRKERVCTGTIFVFAIDNHRRHSYLCVCRSVTKILVSFYGICYFIVITCTFMLIILNDDIDITYSMCYEHVTSK